MTLPGPNSGQKQQKIPNEFSSRKIKNMENDIQIKITQITKIFETMINKIKNMNKNGEQHIYQNNKNYKNK